MAKRDFREILRVLKNTSDEDTRKSYRTMAIEYQSDRHQQISRGTPSLKKG